MTVKRLQIHISEFSVVRSRTNISVLWADLGVGGEPVQFLNCRAGPMQILWDFVHRVSLPWCEDHLSRNTCEMCGYAKSDCRKFFVRNFFIQQLLLPLQSTEKRKQNKQEEGEIERKQKICLLIILFRKCPDRNLFKGCLAFPTGVK